jgi:farnesol dehydrogenase
MNTLVTGATGFIGGRLVQQLLAEGETVHMLCRPGADASSFMSKDIRICRGDILDARTIESAMNGCDFVYHIAGYAKNWARDPRKYIEVNVDGLRRVLDAAMKTGVKRVAVTSTSVIFGPSNGTPTIETTNRTKDFFTDYEYSKYLAEQAVREYVDNGLDVVILNPTRVFGPGLMNEGNSVAKMVELYLQGKFRLILGDGSGVGNYAFVNDVVRGHILAMKAGRTGERYILGGENVSYNEFFRMLSEVSGRKRWMAHIHPTLALAISQVENLRARRFHHYPLITPGWLRTFIADWAFSSEKAERELGYTVTPLRTALETTVQWIQSKSEKRKKSFAQEVLL